MAVTRLITNHISKGETIAQSLKDRFDYGQNPDKTQGWELISSYGLSINAIEVEYLLDLPTGTLAIHRIIEFPSLQIKRNNN